MKFAIVSATNDHHDPIVNVRLRIMSDCGDVNFEARINGQWCLLMWLQTDGSIHVNQYPPKGFSK